MYRKAWWSNYQPGGVEAALEQTKQERQAAQFEAVAKFYQAREAEFEAKCERERQEAEALRARLRGRQRGGKLAWAARLRETPQMRAIRLAAETEGANDGR